jgi:uncharacterized protein YjbJ (UPF0337 family)
MSTDSSNDKAAEARAGLLGSIAGKAKEVAGAITGKDDLVEEGQLQLAEARRRKAALADEAVADAKLSKAAQELDETSRETAEQTKAAGAQAEREKSVVERQRASEHVAADQDAVRQEATDRTAAQETADKLADSRLREADVIATEATEIERQAAEDKLRLEREAAAADHQAAQLRAQTEN